MDACDTVRNSTYTYRGNNLHHYTTIGVYYLILVSMSSSMCCGVVLCCVALVKEWWQPFIRILSAMALGGIIGIEREFVKLKWSTHLLNIFIIKLINTLCIFFISLLFIILVVACSWYARPTNTYTCIYRQLFAATSISAWIC
jgi:hypothetical protein